MKQAEPFSMKKRLIISILIDLAVLAAGLLTFAYFHHVRVREVTPVPVAAAALALPAVMPGDPDDRVGEQRC